MMTIICKRDGCGHAKTKHENTRDWGRNSGCCTVSGCPCSYEIFGFTKHTREEVIASMEKL